MLMAAMACFDNAGRNRLDIFKLLLSKNADVNIAGPSGRTCLHEACLISHMELTKLILEKNPDVNARDEEGMTPLHMAVQRDGLRGEALMTKGRQICLYLRIIPFSS